MLRPPARHSGGFRKKKSNKTAGCGQEKFEWKGRVLKVQGLPSRMFLYGQHFVVGAAAHLVPYPFGEQLQEKAEKHKFARVDGNFSRDSCTHSEPVAARPHGFRYKRLTASAKGGGSWTERTPAKKPRYLRKKVTAMYDLILSEWERLDGDIGTHGKAALPRHFDTTYVRSVLC